MTRRRKASSATGFFKSVGGLESETEVVPYREGGVNDTTRKLVGATKWKNIVLKRGFTGLSPNDTFQKWAREIQAGQDVRKDVTITLIDQDQNEVAKMEFVRCFPVRWALGSYYSPRDPASPRDPNEPPADATPTDLGVETIEIAHEGMKLP